MAVAENSVRSLSSYRIIQIAALLSLLALMIWCSSSLENTVQPETATFKYTASSRAADFPIQSKLIPRHQWPKEDNQTCISEGSKEYPKKGSSLRRMPYAIVMGSMKSGTSALTINLYQHPNVARPTRKELHFFDFQYEHFATADAIYRKTTRKNYRQAFEFVLGDEGMESLLSDPSLYAVDDSPRYIFWSDRVPARILCVAPWAKMLAILRNPIDRAFSHYNMQRNSRKAKKMGSHAPTFEEWIAMDIVLLKETGVIQNEIPNQDFAGSAEEMEAWKEYTRKSRHAPIGRGLYAIQLRHWFQAYEAAGKSRLDFFVIQSERMKNDMSGVYSEILDFLGLEQFELKQETEINTGDYNTKMNEETRRTLQVFYKPYNHELYELLGKEWEGVWDP